MKTTLDSNARHELVRYRLDRARETLKEADYFTYCDQELYDELSPRAEDFVIAISKLI